MSDPFGNDPQATNASRVKRALILSAVIVTGAALVMAALDIFDTWVIAAIIAFEVLSTAFTVWAIGRGRRAKQDESPLSEL